MKKRILAFALVLMLIFAATGCSAKKVSDKKGAASKENIPAANTDKLALPDYKIENKKVTYIVGSDFTKEDSTSIWAQVRKLASEKYGIDFQPILSNTTEQNTLTMSMLAAGTPPSFVETHKTTAWFPRLCSDGIFSDVNTLINREDMLWKDMLGYIDYYSIGDSSYACVTNVYAPETMTYNKNLIKNKGLTDPMELYKKGEWTWDKMLEYIDKICGDTNGDGVIDVYGVNLSYLGQGYMCSLGTGFTTIKDGKVSLSPIKDGNYEKFGTFAADLLSRSSKGYYVPVENAVSSAARLFTFDGYWGVMNNNTQTAKMKAGEIAIIPVPKNSSTDKYYMYGITSGYAICAGDNPVGAAAVLSCYRYLNYPNEENLTRTYNNYIAQGWDENSAYVLTYDVNAQPGAYQDITLVPIGNEFASAEIGSVISCLYRDILEKGNDWATVRDKYMSRLDSAVASSNKSMTK